MSETPLDWTLGFKERNLVKSFLTHRAHDTSQRLCDVKHSFLSFCAERRSCAFLAKKEKKVVFYGHGCTFASSTAWFLANSLVSHCLLHKTEVSFVHTFKNKPCISYKVYYSLLLVLQNLGDILRNVLYISWVFSSILYFSTFD